MLWMRRLTPTGIVGILIMIGMISVAIVAPWISPYDPIEGNLALRLKPPLYVDPNGGFHLLGTDQLGRDMFSRIIYGSRVSLLVGFAAVPVSAVIGSLLGIIAGYRLGLIDEILMRLADIQLAIPFLLLLLAIIAVVGPSFLNLILVLGVARWMPYAKLIRGEVLALREREFVTAANAMGASHTRVILKHILPNVLATVIVWSTVLLPRLILAEASLSFLGLGIPPPTPSWGGMISEGRGYVWQAWWLSTFPGIAIAITVLGGNLIGDWLRDLLDPRLRKSRGR